MIALAFNSNALFRNFPWVYGYVVERAFGLFLIRDLGKGRKTALSRCGTSLCGSNPEMFVKMVKHGGA